MEPGVQYGEDDMGCWFDSNRGIYIGVEVIDEAGSNHWPEYEKLEKEYTKYFLALPEGNPGENWDVWLTEHEHYHDLWDAAENHLNTLTKPGYWFGSNENGDWGLWYVEDEDDDFVESDMRPRPISEGFCEEELMSYRYENNLPLEGDDHLRLS